MAKSAKQQKHQERLSENKLLRTRMLAEEACKYAQSNLEYGASQRRLAEITKIIDPKGRGLSHATLGTSHVQEILARYGIGRFAALPNEGAVDAGMYLELQKELLKRDGEIKKLKDKIKSLNTEVGKLTEKNEVLRHDNMGLMATIDTSGANVAVNNTKAKLN